MHNTKPPTTPIKNNIEENKNKNNKIRNKLSGDGIL